jgi:hypothetical protein
MNDHFAVTFCKVYKIIMNIPTFGSCGPGKKFIRRIPVTAVGKLEI